MVTAIALANPIRVAAEMPNGIQRNAQIELAVDSDGSVAGRGELSLSGDQALLGNAPGVDVSQRHAIWVRWLQSAFEGCRIDGFHLEESAGEQTVLRWRMDRKQAVPRAARAEVMVARPALAAVGPAEVEADHTLPVQLPFVGDELEVVVTWSDQWTPERLPAGVDVTTAAGHLNARRILDSAARRLVYRRTITLADPDAPADTVGPLRDLLAAMRNIDSQTLVLVRHALRP